MSARPASPLPVSTSFRIIGRLFAVIAMTTLLPGFDAASQDPSPAATDSRLAESGYHELRIVVTDDGAEVPTEVPAGRVLVVLENQGTPDGPAAVSDVNILQVSDGITLDDLNAVMTSQEGGEIPDWFSDITSVGGFNVVAGQTGFAVIDLEAGEWFIGVGDFNPYAALTVTADADATAAPEGDPPSDVSVELGDFSNDLPDRLPAGSQVWHVTNNGEQLHEIVLVRTPELLTVEQVMTIVTLPEGGTPPPGVPDMSTFEFLPDVVKSISPGREIWVEPTLEPGNHVAICSTLDPETGMPHLLLGEIRVFTVGDPATP
jgi:hypothetical protein